MVGSTNTIIYECFKESGISIDDETARIMLAGIVSDTRNLSKTTTCPIDSVAWLALTAQLGISSQGDCPRVSVSAVGFTDDHYM